jgi:hypothetical protein
MDDKGGRAANADWRNTYDYIDAHEAHGGSVERTLNPDGNLRG